MAKAPLTAKEVNSSSSDKLWVSPCLYRIRNKTDTFSWSFLYQVNGQRREMGLGSVTDVSLSEARAMVTKWRQVVSQGRDPIIVRNRERYEQKANLVTFTNIAFDCFESRKAELKGDEKTGAGLVRLKRMYCHVLGICPSMKLIKLPFVTP